MSTGHTSLRYRALWAQLGPAGRVAIIVAAVGTLVLIISSRSIVSALLTPSAGAAGAAANDQQQRHEQFKKSFEKQLAQINGRSLFFTPPRPRSPDAPPPPDPGPSAPTSYGGPALIGFANGAAYFSDGRRLAPGEKVDGNLKVASLSPPWSAVVEWEGVEFTVTLFDRDHVIYPNVRTEPVASASATSAPAIDAASPPAPSPDAPAAEPSSAGTDQPAPGPETPAAAPPPAPEPSPNPEPR